MILVRKLILTVILNKIFCTEEFLNEKCGMFDYHKKYDGTNLQCLPDAFYVPTSYIINNVSNVILKVRTLPLLDVLRSL